ncbi:putative ribonuclease H-like domain-containing protein [Tanacetum coccineum]
MSHEEPVTQIAPVESPQMVSTVKLPILKKVILNGDGPIQVTTDEKGVETKVPPKTAQALLARQRERKAKSILLLAIPDEYQLRFHAIKDAKTLWAAIKSRFGGNIESKKMQKNVLKQQFENFSVSDTEGPIKSIYSFKTISQLNSWAILFKVDIKGSSGSSSNSQNVGAFLFAEDTAREIPQHDLKNKGIFDSGCSRHIIGNKYFLTDYQDIDGGFVAFGGSARGVKGNLVRGLPSKIFDNDHTCVACQKGKQHKASCKDKLMSSISQLLQMLHMDLFGPTSVRSINHKTYFLVVTDDFSRFSWVFFLAFKDETSGVLKKFITEIENQLNYKVKVIRCDNGTEFKNREMNELCGLKGIKREFSVARTPQQNRVAERKNRTLIEAARTMLADSLLTYLILA